MKGKSGKFLPGVWPALLALMGTAVRALNAPPTQVMLLHDGELVR